MTRWKPSTKRLWGTMTKLTPEQEQLLQATEREYQTLLPRKLSQLEEKHHLEREEARSKFYGQIAEAVRLGVPIRRMGVAMGTKDFRTVQRLYERFSGSTG